VLIIIAYENDLSYEEVRVHLLSPPRKTTSANQDSVTHELYKHSNWPGTPHDVVRVTSADCDESWYIDLTGAQYGLEKALWASDEYHALIDMSKSTTYTLGYNRSVLDDLDHEGSQLRPIMGAFDCMNDATDSWVQGDIELEKVVELPSQVEFEEREKSLLAALDQAVKAHVAKLNSEDI
jgi:hypothetical protein